MRGCLYFLFIFLTYETLPMIVPPETNCYSKGFICYDEDRFYQCVDIGNKTVTMGEPQACPQGLKCNDGDEIECGEPWSAENDSIPVAIYSTTSTTDSNIHDKIKHTDSLSPEITSSPINTINTTEDEFVSIQNLSTQFLETNNQYATTNNDIQTEPISVYEETKFVTEFNKLTVAITDNVTKLLPLDSKEFLDVQTTKLPPVENTDESLSGWKEPIWEPDEVVELGNTKNTYTTEFQTTQVENTDESLSGWKRPVWESDEAVELGNPKNTNTTKVQTTKLPPAEDTDESLSGSIWEPDEVLELGTAKNTQTTEVETIMTDAPEDADYEYIYNFWNEDIAGEKPTSIVYGTPSTNEEKESSTGITSIAKPFADGLIFDDISISTTIEHDVTTRTEVLKSTTEELETTTGNIPSASQPQTFNFTTEKNEVTLNLETQSSETEAPVDDEQSTVISFYQTFQQENSKYTTTENKLFTFETETAMVDTTTSTEQGNGILESTDNKDHSTQTGSSLNYANSFITSDGYAITTFTTTEGFASSNVTNIVDSGDQTTSGYSKEITIEDTKSEVVTSDTDTTLSVESQEISRIFTTTESDLIGWSKVTSMESESILNSTVTKNILEDSKATVTENENELYNVDTDSITSTVTTDWFISKDIDELISIDENQVSQSTLKSDTANTEATLDNTTKEDLNFRDESGIEVMTRLITDTTSYQESDVFEESTKINETSITPTYNAETSTSFTSGIFTEELITTEINISPDEISRLLTTTTGSITDKSNSEYTEATSFESRTTSLGSEGFSSIQENILETDISTIRVKVDGDTENASIHSTSSQVNTTESSSDQENTQEIYTTKESTSKTVDLPIENSTDSLLELPITSLPSTLNTQRDNTESTTDNKEVVEFDNNFTTEDTLSATEIQESSKTTELLSTLSLQEIITTNNSTSSTEFEVTTTTTSFLTNHINDTNLPVNVSIVTEEASIVYDNEVSTGSLSLNTTEPVSSEEESSLPESETFSTSSDVTTPSYIFTSHVTTNSETSDTEFSSKEFSSTFTCPSAGKFPDSKSCSKFYLCINAFVKYMAVALDCPKGTLFDSAGKECTRRPVQCPGEILLTCTTSGVYPHPTDCSRYYKCLWRSFNKNFILKQFKCPRGTRYHSGSRRCERTSVTECGNSFVPEITDDISFKCVEAGRFAVESGCREYYECKEKNGEMTSQRKTCSESKLFDAEWGRCRKSHWVVCPFGDYDSRETSESDERSMESLNKEFYYQ